MEVTSTRLKQGFGQDMMGPRFNSSGMKTYEYVHSHLRVKGMC